MDMSIERKIVAHCCWYGAILPSVDKLGIHRMACHTMCGIVRWVARVAVAQYKHLSLRVGARARPTEERTMRCAEMATYHFISASNRRHQQIFKVLPFGLWMLRVCAEGTTRTRRRARLVSQIIYLHIVSLEDNAVCAGMTCMW